MSLARMSIARAAVLVLASACAGCAGGAHYAGHWDGRRGYDGHGDYGYDLAAARSEAGDYRTHAARTYAAPGTPDDPWGPYIAEAAARFAVPERWIRAVMRQESGGHLYETDGSLITSSAGAMRLMQVMPRTYDMLRQRYGLAGDPYDPHDNIIAGTAYIREMYDRFGSPNFLAAYNAGPDRLESWLSGGSPLPDETVNYLASVAPRLGTGMAAGGAPVAAAPAAAAPAAAAPIWTTGQDDSSLRAFDGGGLVTAAAPTGVLAAPAPVPMLVPVAAVAPRRGDWGIQVGAYADPADSASAIASARARAGGLLAGTRPAITSVERGRVLYRARLVGLSAESAAAACAQLAGGGMDCFTVPPGPAL